MNKIIVSLIPKIQHLEKIAQFGPISLVNTSYKIISKILVKRLRTFLTNRISPNRNSTIPGRGTVVNFIVASNILHSMKKKKTEERFLWVQNRPRKA